MPLLARQLSGVFPSSGLIFAVLFALHGVAPKANAQDQPKTVTEGYVTSLNPPDGFTINGSTHVTTTPTTSYRWFGSKSVENTPAPSNELQIGVFVRVTGKTSEKSVSADGVELRDLGDKTIRGFGLIDKALDRGPEPAFRADGYRIRMSSGTTVKFSSSLKSLTDVGTNDWVQYEGKLDKTGDLVASRADFSPGKTGTKKAGQMTKDAKIPDAIPANAAIIDANGNFKGKHAKVRYGDSGGWCGWHRLAEDPELQARVQRVGRSLIPEYQDELAASDAEKVHFRFYAVEETEIRSELVCNSGLILVPRQMAMRFRSDDQLAATLADGVAYYLQIQSKKLDTEGWALGGIYLGGLAAERFVPGMELASIAGVDIAAYRIDMLLEQQRGRMALALMDDAGYDPWAAPEAWRLMAPKKLPANLDSLKYPNRSGYQLAILNLQYRKSGAGAAAGTQ